MRAVVTGGLGFVGRHLAQHLRAEGDDVTVLDHRGAGSLDITDGPAVTARLAAIEPEVVYHLAGWADVGASWNDPVGVFRVNAEGTLHVLRACRAAGVARVLAVASADVYGVVTDQFGLAGLNALYVGLTLYNARRWWRERGDRSLDHKSAVSQASGLSYRERLGAGS